MGCAFDKTDFITNVISAAALSLQGSLSNWRIPPVNVENFTTLSDTERSSTVKAITKERKKAVPNVNEIGKAHLLEHYREGKLLVFFPDSSLADGVAKALAPNYFFTVENLPYPQVWLCYICNVDNILPHLLAWVPPSSIENVTLSIRSCADGSIIYFSDLTIDVYYEKLLKI